MAASRGSPSLPVTPDTISAPRMQSRRVPGNTGRIGSRLLGKSHDAPRQLQGSAELSQTREESLKASFGERGNPKIPLTAASPFARIKTHDISFESDVSSISAHEPGESNPGSPDRQAHTARNLRITMESAQQQERLSKMTNVGGQARPSLLAQAHPGIRAALRHLRRESTGDLGAWVTGASNPQQEDDTGRLAHDLERLAAEEEKRSAHTMTTMSSVTNTSARSSVHSSPQRQVNTSRTGSRFVADRQHQAAVDAVDLFWQQSSSTSLAVDDRVNVGVTVVQHLSKTLEANRALHERVHALEDQLEMSKHDNAALNTVRATSDRDAAHIRELQEELARTQDSLRKMAERLGQAQQQSTTLAARLEATQADLVAVQRERDSQTSLIQTQTANDTKAMSELEKTISAQLTSISRLESAAHEDKVTIAKLTRQLESVNADRDDLQARNDTLRTDLSHTRDEAVKAHQTVENEQQRELRELRMKVREYESVIDANLTKMSSLEESNAAGQRLILEFKQEADSLRSAVLSDQDRQRVEASLKQRVAELERDSASDSKIIAELKQVAEGYAHTIEKLQREASVDRNTIQDLRALGTSIETQAAADGDAVEVVRSERDAAQAEALHLRTQVEDLRQAVENDKATIKELMAAASEYYNTIGDMHARDQGKRDESDRAATDLRDAKDQVASTTSLLNNAKAEIEHLKKRLQHAQQSKLDDELLAREAERQSLVRQDDNARFKELTQVSDGYFARITDLEAAAQIDQDTINSLRTELSDMRQRVKSLKATSADAHEREVAAFQTELETQHQTIQSMKDDLAQYDDTVQALQREKRSLDEAYTQACLDRDNARSHLERAQNMNEADASLHAHEVSTLTARLEVEKSAAEHLDAVLNDRAHELEQAYRERNDEVRELRNEVSRLKFEADAAEAAMQHTSVVQDHLAQATREIDEATSRADTLEEKLQQTRADCDQLRDELDASRIALQEAASAHAADLERAEAEYSENLQELRDQKKKEAGDLEQAIAALRLELQEADHQLRTAENKLKRSEDAKVKAEGIVSDLQEQLDSISSAAGESDASKAVMEIELAQTKRELNRVTSGSEAQITTLSRQVETLDGQLDASREKLRMTDAALRETEKRVADLKALNEALTVEKKQWSNDAAELASLRLTSQRIPSLEEDLAGYKERLAQSEASVASAESEAANAREREKETAARLNQQLQEAHAKTEQLFADLETATKSQGLSDSKESQLRDTLRDRDRQIARLHQVHEELQSAIVTQASNAQDLEGMLQATKDLLQKEREDHKANLAEARERSHAAEEEHQREMQETRLQAAKEERRAGEAERTVGQLQANLDSARADIANLKTSLARAEEEAAAKDHQCTALSAELEAEKSELHAVNSRLAELEGTVAAQASATSAIKAELSSAKQEKDRVLEAVKQARDENAQQDKDAQRLTDQIEELQRTLFTTKEDLGVLTDEVIGANAQLRAVLEISSPAKAPKRRVRDLPSVSNAVTDVVAKVGELRRQVDDLQQQAEEAEKQLGNVSSERDALRKKLDSKGGRLTEVQDSVRQMVLEVAGMEEAMSKASSQKTTLAGDVKRLEDKLQSERQRLEYADARMQELKDTNAALEQQLATLSEDKKEVDDRVAALSKENVRAGRQLDKLGGKSENQGEQIRDLETKIDSLTDALESAKESINNLDGLNQSLQRDRDGLVRELTDVRTQNMSLQVQVDQLHKQIEGLEAQVHNVEGELRDTSMSHEETVASLEGIINKKDAQGKEAEHRLQLLGSKLQDISTNTRGRISDLQKEMNALSEEKAANENRLRGLIDLTTKEKEHMQELLTKSKEQAGLAHTRHEKEINALRAELDAARDHAEALRAKSKEDLDAARSKAERELEAAKQKAERELEAANQEAEIARKKLAATTSHLNELTARAEADRGALQRSSVAVSDARRHADEASAEMAAKDSDLTRVRSLLDLTTQEKNNADARLTQLMARLEKEQARSQELEDAMIAREQQVVALLKGKDAKIQDAKKSAKHLRSERDSIMSTASSVREELDTASSELSALRARVDEQGERVSELESQLSAARSDVRMAQSRHTAEEGRVNSLEEKAAQLEEEGREHKLALERAKRKAEASQKQLDAAEAKCAKLREKVAALEDKVGAATADAEAAKAQAAEDMDRLRQSYKDVDKGRSETAEQIRGLQEHIASMKTEASKKDQALEGMAVLRYHSEGLEEQLGHARDEIKELTARANHAEGLLEGNGTRAADVSADNEALRAEIADLKRDLDSVRQENAKLNGEVSKANGELNEARTSAKMANAKLAAFGSGASLSPAPSPRPSQSSPPASPSSSKKKKKHDESPSSLRKKSSSKKSSKSRRDSEPSTPATPTTVTTGVDALELPSPLQVAPSPNPSEDPNNSVAQLAALYEDQIANLRAEQSVAADDAAAWEQRCQDMEQTIAALTEEKETLRSELYEELEEVRIEANAWKKLAQDDEVQRTEIFLDNEELVRDKDELETERHKLEVQVEQLRLEADVLRDQAAQAKVPSANLKQARADNAALQEEVEALRGKLGTLKTENKALLDRVQDLQWQGLGGTSNSALQEITDELPDKLHVAQGQLRDTRSQLVSARSELDGLKHRLAMARKQHQKDSIELAQREKKVSELTISYNKLSVFKLDIIARELKKLEIRFTQGRSRATGNITQQDLKRLPAAQREGMIHLFQETQREYHQARGHVKSIIDQCLSDTLKYHIGSAVRNPHNDVIVNKQGAKDEIVHVVQVKTSTVSPSRGGASRVASTALSGLRSPASSTGAVASTSSRTTRVITPNRTRRSSAGVKTPGRASVGPSTPSKASGSSPTTPATKSTPPRLSASAIRSVQRSPGMPSPGKTKRIHMSPAREHGY